MTRRFFLLAPFGAVAPLAAKDGERVPTDAEDLNRFALQYNTYVELMKRGLVDLKVWARTKRAWRSLTE